MLKVDPDDHVQVRAIDMPKFGLGRLDPASIEILGHMLGFRTDALDVSDRIAKIPISGKSQNDTWRSNSEKVVKIPQVTANDLSEGLGMPAALPRCRPNTARPGGSKDVEESTARNSHRRRGSWAVVRNLGH
jgi:hypothetical protein